MRALWAAITIIGASGVDVIEMDIMTLQHDTARAQRHIKEQLDGLNRAERNIAQLVEEVIGETAPEPGKGGPRTPRARRDETTGAGRPLRAARGTGAREDCHRHDQRRSTRGAGRDVAPVMSVLVN